MIEAAALIGFHAVAAAILLNLYRLAAGPDVVDRVLALDTLSINAIALVVLVGIAFGSELYFEAALILAHQEIAEGDEVAAAQALIEQLGLRGVLFTADALHCQKNVRLRNRDRQRAPGATQAQPARPA